MASKVTFLPSDFIVEETHFSPLPENSLVVLDDFAFRQANNKQAKLNFNRIVNYVLRHKKITLVLVIHNLFHNNLSTEILYAPHLFLSYSNIGYLIIRCDIFIFFNNALGINFILQKIIYASGWS
jgi:hypothetical protein